MPKKPSYDVDELIEQLFHEKDLDIRRYIPDKLAKIGDWRSTEPLGKVLTNSKEPLILRNECAESLGKQGDPNALPYLESGLQSDDPELRRTCIWSIGQIGLPEGIGLLRNVFSDPDLMCQRWIAKSLGRISHPDSATCLLDYYNYLTQEKALSDRVLDDIIRAAADLSEFLEKEVWNDISVSILHSSDRKITLQAVLNLIVSIGTCPFDSSTLIDYLNKLWHPLTKSGLGKLCYTYGFDSILEQLWNSHADLEILSFLVALKYPEEAGRFLQMCNDLDRCLAVGRGLLLGNHLTSNYLKVTNSFSPDNLDLQQIRYEIKVRMKRDISIIFEMLKTPPLITKAIRLLEFLGDHSEIDRIFRDYGVNGEKKYVQAVVSTIGRIFKKGVVTEPLKDVLHQIIANERVWHIRRDARLLLRTYS